MCSRNICKPESPHTNPLSMTLFQYLHHHPTVSPLVRRQVLFWWELTIIIIPDSQLSNSLFYITKVYVLCCNASTFLLVPPSACIIPLQYRIQWLIKILFSYRTLEWICSWASLWTTAIFQVRIIVAPENYPSNTTCEHPSPYRAAFSVTWFSTTKSLVCWRTLTKHRTVGGTSIKTAWMY